MPIRHLVELGEYLLRLAARHGFRDHRTIENHPDNAGLKQHRFNLNSLAPGDEIVIPDKEPVSRSVPSDQMHTFKVIAPRTIVNLRLQHERQQPMATRSGAFATTVEEPKGRDQHRLLITTSGDGETASKDRRPALDGRVSLVETPEAKAEQFDLLVGHLLPLTTRAGQQARLNNLGYFAGYDPANDEQFAWAVEEFQRDRFPPPKKVKGVQPDGSLDQETLRALGAAHGDLLPGQEATL